MVAIVSMKSPINISKYFWISVIWFLTDSKYIVVMETIIHFFYTRKLHQSINAILIIIELFDCADMYSHRFVVSCKFLSLRRLREGEV